MAGARWRWVREGENMDQRILLIVLGVGALAFASLAFASGGQAWSANGTQLDSWNGTAMRHGMMRGIQGGGNATGCSMMREEGNGTFAQSGAQRFNSAEQKAFEAAVESGDFTAATKLHEEYGFGGQMFGKLNATTFAKFSQVHKLQAELMTDLGMNATGMMPPLLEGPGFGNGQGMRGGRGMMEPEFAKGMHQGKDTNQTTQQ